jgi:DNA-binding transcriptional regulator YdaS (Cro superfamily)
MLFKAAIAFACMMLMATALAQNPADMISSKVNAQIDAAKQNLTQKAVERITEGNLTKESLQKDLNATKEELKQKAVQTMNVNANITTGELQQKAKDELKNQVNQKVQQPGFEIILALTVVILIAGILRRRD